jgi:hypothetical protein
MQRDAVIGPTIMVGLLTLLGCSLRPPEKPPTIDGNCKVIDTAQVCKATLRGYKKVSGGWVLYLEGKGPYEVRSSRLPRNRVGRNISMEVVVDRVNGPLVKSWETIY